MRTSTAQGVISRLAQPATIRTNSSTHHTNPNPTTTSTPFRRLFSETLPVLQSTPRYHPHHLLHHYQQQKQQSAKFHTNPRPQQQERRGPHHPLHFPYREQHPPHPRNPTTHTPFSLLLAPSPRMASTTTATRTTTTSGPSPAAAASASAAPGSSPPRGPANQVAPPTSGTKQQQDVLQEQQQQRQPHPHPPSVIDGEEVETLTTTTTSNPGTANQGSSSSTTSEVAAGEERGQEEEADKGNKAPAPPEAHAIPALPAPPEGGEQGASRTLEVDGKAVALDHLGPMVVGRDGTVSRIANWGEMTELERRNTLRILCKRNRVRLAALRDDTNGGTGLHE